MAKRAQQEPKRLRVYEQWQGNERFFCWGCCVTGPSWKSGMGSLLLLIAPTVVFLVFVAPYMARALNPVVLVISCILPVFCVTMLLMTSCRDPGILPRQEPDEEWLQGRKARAKDVMVNGQRVTVRYNDTCHFYQPPRAHHCSVNDNCIERFDHHCPWVGTTIGKRNYRTFLLFIYGTSIYIAWTFGISLGSLFVKHRELEQAAAAGDTASGDSLGSNLWLKALGESGAAIALMVLAFIFFWFVCGLSGFHTWLVASNQTTYENFRYNHNQVPNPYDEGFFRNCASVWCIKIAPSKVQFRAYLDEVQKVPVELGYPEWNAAMAASSLRTDVEMPTSGGSTAPAQDVARYPVMARQAMPSSPLPQQIQGYDSLTDGSSQIPVSHTENRFEDSRAIAAQQRWSQQPSTAAISVQAAGSSPSAQLNSQQQGRYDANTAAGLQAPAAAAGDSGTYAQRQQGLGQQGMQGFNPLGGVEENGESVQPITAEQVAIELPIIAGGSSSASRQQQQQQGGAAAIVAAAHQASSMPSNVAGSSFWQTAVCKPAGGARGQQLTAAQSSEPGTAFLTPADSLEGNAAAAAAAAGAPSSIAVWRDSVGSITDNGDAATACAASSNTDYADAQQSDEDVDGVTAAPSGVRV